MISTFRVKRREKIKYDFSDVPFKPTQIPTTNYKSQQQHKLTSFSQYCVERYGSRLQNDFFNSNESSEDFGKDIIRHEVREWNQSDSRIATKGTTPNPMNKTTNQTFITGMINQGDVNLKGSIMLPPPKKNQTFLLGDIRANLTRIKKKQFTNYIREVVNDTKQTRVKAQLKANQTFGVSKMWHKSDLNKEYFPVPVNVEILTDIKQMDEQLDDLKKIYNHNQNLNQDISLTFVNWTRKDLGSVHQNKRSISENVTRNDQKKMNEQLNKQRERFTRIMNNISPYKNQIDSFEIQASIDYFMKKDKNK